MPIRSSPRRRRRPVLARTVRLTACAVLLAACGGGADDAADTTAALPVPPLDPPASTVPGAVDAPGAEPTAPCPTFGLWRACSLEERVESAGLAPRRVASDVRQPGLSVPGVAWRLGQGELQAFFYADSADARREAERLDVRDLQPAQAEGIRRPPAVIRSANAVALMFNNNDRQLERVRLAITAGLPLR